MAENLMNSEHKATNDAYRDNYDRIFRRKDSLVSSECCGQDQSSGGCAMNFYVLSANIFVDEEIDTEKLADSVEMEMVEFLRRVASQLKTEIKAAQITLRKTDID